MRDLQVFRLLLLSVGALAFLPDPSLVGNKKGVWVWSTQEESSSVVGETTVTLTKPLGLTLEEVQEGAAAGVFVKEISEAGSAFALADEIQGKTVAKVMGVDCTALDFDAVMDLIVNTESAEVTLSFTPMNDAAETTPTFVYKEGDTVTVKVRQTGKEDLIFDAKVGDNLRQALIENKFEVYQGMKQKLGNCG